MPLPLSLARAMLISALALGLSLAPIRAAAQSLIRDADIEHALRQVAQPILQAAGLPGSTRIYVINDSSLNAFVIDTRSIFLHSGLLAQFDTAAPIQAVIAHEAAHIANGHLSRRAANFGRANSAARLGLLLSLAAAAAGGAEAGAGVAIGTGSSALRRFFAHTRAEEASADQSSLRYMASAGVPPEAALEVLDIFRGQEALSPGRRDPYASTHPMSRDRLRAIQGFAAATSVRSVDTTAVDYYHRRATGKLTAFIRAPSWTLRRVRGQDDEISVMRRAIAYHRQPDPTKALREMDRLLAMRPGDGYYHELHGQILLESRNTAAAVNAYRRAASLIPREPLIQAGLGRALLALDTGASNREALEVLSRARSRDPGDARLLRDLALAHARAGQNGLASVATAERYAVRGRLEDARIHAERAQGLLGQGTRGYLRAQDVLAAAQQAERQRR